MGKLLKLITLLLCFMASTLNAQTQPSTSTCRAKQFVGFERGMGIGGWLTNYKRFNVLPEKWRQTLSIGDFEHFATYITEDDLKNIASMGVDHVRVGFDQIVLEESPYVYREEIFKHIDNFIAWSKKYNLNVVLNLHKALGNYCDIPAKIPLMKDPQLRARFTALWVEFEKRYANEPNVVFELMNEVTSGDPALWNSLAEETINAIRKSNPTRKIIIGGIDWNSCGALSKIKIFDDENVIYTFHVYDPYEFTHQRGVLQKDPLYYNRKMFYPSSIEPYRDFRKFCGWGGDPYKNFEKMDINYMRHVLQPAFDFVKAHPDKILWCGEFGTIRHTDIKSRENWMNDIIKLLKEHGISYCVWNYLSTPNDGNRFSLVDDDNRKILSPRLGKIILGDVQ